MPFTPNRAFKADPRMLSRAEGMYYFTPDGRPILDGTSGLWCVAAGHGRPRIVEAIRRAAGELDYVHSFNMGHPVAFEFASRLAGLMPKGLDRIFFTNSGSESCDTALKIALACSSEKASGQGRQVPADRPRARLSWRQLRRRLGGRHRPQPDELWPHGRRRRSPAAHPRHRPQRLLPRPADARAPRTGRRPGAAGCWSTTPRPSPR